MSYEGYGIRARKDLTANARPQSDAERAMQNAELDASARAIIGLCEHAEAKRQAHITLSLKGATRLANALLLVAHREESTA